MSRPVTNLKPFDKWTFEDLRSWAAWVVVQSLLAGTPLKDAMHEVCSRCALWKPPR